MREEPALRLGDGRMEIDPHVLLGSSAAELAHQAVGIAEVQHSTPRRLEEQPLELSREERALEGLPHGIAGLTQVGARGSPHVGAGHGRAAYSSGVTDRRFSGGARRLQTVHAATAGARDRLVARARATACGALWLSCAGAAPAEPR